MAYQRKLPPLEPCCVEYVTGIIAGKWKARILDLLRDGHKRLSELRRDLPGASQQVLAAQIEALASDGMIVKGYTTYRTQLTRTYALTDKARTLLELLEPIASWGRQQIAAGK